MNAKTRKSCMNVQLVCTFLFFAAFIRFSPAQTVQRSPAIHITGYDIDVILDPAHHSIATRAAVTFTALGDLATVRFHLNPELRVDDVVDASGRDLNAARDSEVVRVAPSTALKRGSSATWTFTYSGVFGAGGGSTTAVHLASVGDPVSYLLYAAEWFPVADMGTGRFTAAMHVHVPVGERVFGSGSIGSPHVDKNGRMIFDFDWKHPGFPGTIVAGKFREPYTVGMVRVYRTGEKNGANGQKIAAIAARQYDDFRSRFGNPDVEKTQVSEPRPGAPTPIQPQLDVVELPDGTLPAYSAPGIVAIAGRLMQGDKASRLLANTIAHQWWGDSVSPATLDDAWVTNGMCRFSELQWLEKTSDHDTFRDAVLNVSASALAYDTVPLSRVSRYPEFSPEFEAMTYDKGAMIFRMLQWQIGDAAFQQTLRGMLSQASRSISSADVERIAEAASHQNLRPFFTQWLDSTGAPTLTDNWTLYRLGDNKGFRTVGEITEDLDLFRMPVDVRVETDGKTVNQRVDVVGPQSRFVIETAGTPKKISLDPDRRLLRSDDDMQVRVHVLRGENMAAQNDSAGAIREYRRALGIDDISSLASYRLAEVYFGQKNYQAAANAFRDALHGDGLPGWTEVWSDLQLGKIFDATGQRDRAVNQYRRALQTRDDTGGALELAREYIAHAYQVPKAQSAQ